MNVITNYLIIYLIKYYKLLIEYQLYNNNLYFTYFKI